MTHLYLPTKNCHVFLFKFLFVTVFFSRVFFFHSAPEEGLYGKPKYRAILFKIRVFYSVLFHFVHICRWDQCVVHILYSKISTDPGLLKIRHSHRFVAVVIQFLIST